MRRARFLSILFAALLCGMAVLGGCAPTQRKLIVGANDVQDTLAAAYNEAKAQELAAAQACGTAARAAAMTPSPAVCAQLGIPLPYDAAKLNAIAGPINALYDAVRAADKVRLAWQAGTASGGDFALALAAVTDAVPQFLAAAREAGLHINTSKLDAWLASAGGTK